jgi:nitrite reductase/ring-hydroxylating ferredoxin subunit
LGRDLFIEPLAPQTIVCARLEAVDLLLIRDGNQIFTCERACPREQADLSSSHVAGRDINAFVACANTGAFVAAAFVPAEKAAVASVTNVA